jgi:sugar/nucleoside kinase (ribokinase family)
MKSKYDLVCVGDCVVDTFIELQEATVRCDRNREHCILSMAFGDKIPYKSFMVMPGVGNPGNVAVGSARLGLRTAFLTAIGNDYSGHEIMKSYRREGIVTDYVKVNKNIPTNQHFVLTYGAERTILVKHNEYVYDRPAILDKKTDWIYFSSLGPHSLPFHTELAHYMKRHSEIRMGFNPNTFQLRFGIEKMKEIYRHTYVLFVNREEAEMVLKEKSGTDIRALFDGLHALGPKIVLITDGPKGAYASNGTSRYFMPPYPDPRPPISRTGAGDAFSTGFMGALIYGLPVHEALRWAPIESMHVVQFFGAQTGLLSKRALQALLKKAPKSYVAKPL